MKVYVTRRCGHDEKISVYGPYRGRDAAIERESNKLCYACWRKRRDCREQYEQAHDKLGFLIREYVRHYADDPNAETRIREQLASGEMTEASLADWILTYRFEK